MMGKQEAASILKKIRRSDGYFVQKAKLEFALELKRVMDRLEVSNSEMADRLGVSRPMVTKLLRGDANLTIETMVKLCRRLEGNLYIRIVRNGCSARLFEIVKAANLRAHAPAAGAVVKGHFGMANNWYVAANDTQQPEDTDEAKPVAA